MDKNHQAKELCIAARMAYTVLLATVKEEYGKPLLKRAEQAIYEPFYALNRSKAAINVIQKELLRLERQGIKEVFRHHSGLSVIYALHYFLNEQQEKYLDIPEGSALWDTANGIFDIGAKFEATAQETENAPKEGKEIADRMLVFFQSKGFFQ